MAHIHTLRHRLVVVVDHALRLAQHDREWGESERPTRARFDERVRHDHRDSSTDHISRIEKVAPHPVEHHLCCVVGDS